MEERLDERNPKIDTAVCMKTGEEKKRKSQRHWALLYGHCTVAAWGGMGWHARPHLHT